jgi:hypothetical protein
MGVPIRSALCGLVCAFVIALAPVSALAEDPGEGMPAEGGLGFGAAVATLIYGPAKIVYALGGTVVGGLAWAFSGGDADVAWTVLTPSVRGDYVITRDHLTGERPIEFFGRSPEYQPEPREVASAAPVDMESDIPDGW